MQKGFTLIELIISVAIFAAMTALIIARYGSFNQNTLVTNIAYDMALTIRTAQTYGLSVKSNDNGTNSDDFTSAYGIHFDPADATSFTFFADSNGNKVMDTGEAIKTYTITQGASISSICLGSDQSNCNRSDGSILSSGTTLDVTYKRPNPDAQFYLTQGGVTNSNAEPIVFVKITSSDKTNNQVVYIRKNGQISVGY